MPYIWDHNRPRIRPDGERIEPGEEFEPTDHELRAFSYRIEEAPDIEEQAAEAVTDTEE